LKTNQLWSDKFAKSGTDNSFFFSTRFTFDLARILIVLIIHMQKKNLTSLVI
jgi:hypothetical protein